jgi:peptidoglycan-N-acetylglucosamine deacetylase
MPPRLSRPSNEQWASSSGSSAKPEVLLPGHLDAPIAMHRLPTTVLLVLVGCVAARPEPIPSQTRSASPVEIAVTVDDLPAHGPLVPGLDRLAIAERLLAAFRAHHLPPVYGFVNGKKVDDDPTLEAVLQRWVAAGNLLGNHTYSHPSLNDHALPDYLADLDRGEDILARVAPPGTWHYFRYPFLFEGDTAEKRHGVREHLTSRDYSIAEVTIDADDWAFNPPYARCTAQGDMATLASLRRELVKVHVEELDRMRTLGLALTGREVRQVLLLHVGVAESETIDELLTAYEHAGAVWVTLDRALADPIFADPPDLLARYGAAFPYRVAKARGVTVPPAIFQRGLEERLDALCR